MDKSTLLSKLYDILLENKFYYCGILDLDNKIGDTFFVLYGFTNFDVSDNIIFINEIGVRLELYEKEKNYKVNKYGLEISKLIIK